jgi:hypothetical protein
LESDQVVYLEADGAYTFLVGTQDIYRLSKNLKTVIEDHLKNYPQIIKISNSNAVHLNAISAVVGRGIDGINIKTELIQTKQKKFNSKGEEKTFKVASYLSVSSTYKDDLSKKLGL